MKRYRDMSALTLRSAMFAVAAILAGCASQPVRPACQSEQFDAFLPRYMTERAFATERTVFPLESLGTAEGRKTLVTLEQFAKSSMLADVIRADHLSSRQRATPDGVELNVFKPDADSHIYFYRFRQQNGCWQLWQFEDASM
jgi:hypothetical protein